jgi:hypothetical protein
MTKPIKLEQQGCDAPVRLHVGYVGITREGKRVEITYDNYDPEYQWESEFTTYTDKGRVLLSQECMADIIGPWVETPVEPLVDYNDGKWHGWAGGECPVHPSSVVEIKFINGYANEIQEGSNGAGNFAWVSISHPIISFRVTKEYVETPKVPREFWVSNNDGFAHDSLNSVLSDMLTEKHGYTHVREVLTDD